MLQYIIRFSAKNKFIVLLFTLFIIGFGCYSLSQISVGAVPDVTNNQVQVITTSRNLSAQDMEQFITYPVELEMANLPGVKEIRSVSKFGLSVITLVFEDDMGIFLPRQLIAEIDESSYVLKLIQKNDDSFFFSKEKVEVKHNTHGFSFIQVKKGFHQNSQFLIKGTFNILGE